MAKGGEGLILDIGAPVEMVDLVKKMIQSSGFEINIDIEEILNEL